MPAKPAAAPSPLIDQDALPLKELARGVLAREFRPRVSSIRRLAEAALAQKPAAKKKKKKAAKASGKKRKQAKIPGQKKDQKKGK